MAYYLFTQLLISKNPIRNASRKMNFFSPRVNFMWINFSFLSILTTVPLPNFLCMKLLSTANASNWALRLISALLGAAEDFGVEGGSRPCWLRLNNGHVLWLFHLYCCSSLFCRPVLNRLRNL